MTEKIAFIQTGGTIDKDYPKKTGGYAFEIDKPAFHRILEKSGLNPEFDQFEHLKKDSLEITDQDRDNLKDFINKLPNRRVIITHGTDTLIDTAKHLLSLTDRIIVLTGAKLPERFSNSDASLNVGMAMGVALTADPGVYICMQGKVILARQAGRDPIEGTFFEESGEFNSP